MTEILKFLEPRHEEGETILFNELDDFTEIMFFNKGWVDVGFEINRKKMYCLRKKQSIVIADHGCTFNHKSNFIYKTKTSCEGYSIRKNNWQNVLELDEEIADQLKQGIVTSYFYGTKLKIMCEKRKEIKRLSHRNDIHQILVVTDKDQSRDIKFLKQNFNTIDDFDSAKETKDTEKAIEDALDNYTNTVIDICKRIDDYGETTEKMNFIIQA